MDNQEKPEGGERRPRGWRAGFILLLLILYGTLVYASFVLHPVFLKPLIEVPPNRTVVPSGLLMGVFSVTNLFAAFWWVFGLGAGGLGFLTWKGALDWLIKPLTGLALLLCLAAGALVGYIHWIPGGVDPLHGRKIPQLPFGAPVPK